MTHWLQINITDSEEIQVISQSLPGIIPCSEHGITATRISENALRVLHRLHEADYQAYLVGGAVRDLLLGEQPKDFDIATNAHPDQIKALFRNCRLIGRRFRLAHIRYGREVIEVATFRGAHQNVCEDIAHQHKDGRILRDNAYGTIDDDVWRRDLTVNALFYDIKDTSVVDYVGGMEDIRKRQIRVIGDPEIRFREDPVRMLRALRFKAKLGFELVPDMLASIADLAPMLDEIPAARLFDEVLKLFQKGGHALRSFEVLRERNLFGYLFLQTEDALKGDRDGALMKMITVGLANTDKRVQQGKPVNPAFLYAFLLWGALRDELRSKHSEDMRDIPAVTAAAREVFQAQVQQTAIHKRFSIQAREIWMLQSRFEQRRGKRPVRLLAHPRFRAAYDFMLLRNEAGEDLQEMCDWWTRFQEQDENSQYLAVRAGHQEKGRRHRRAPRKRQNAGNLHPES